MTTPRPTRRTPSPGPALLLATTRARRPNASRPYGSPYAATKARRPTLPDMPARCMPRPRSARCWLPPEPVRRTPRPVDTLRRCAFGARAGHARRCRVRAALASAFGPSDTPTNRSAVSVMSSFTVPLNGQSMQLRPSELASVASGLEPNPSSDRLVEAVRAMPQHDRAPLWELAVRHYGRRKPVPQAAGEIGMDVRHAQRLLSRLSELLAAVPAPPA